MNPASSGKQVKKTKATKKDTAPASTGSDVLNHQPSFSHRKPGARFGFGQPGTELHQQALNSFATVAKKKRTCLPSDPTAHPPAVTSTRPTPKAPTTSTSVVRQTNAHLYKDLDPVLWPTADELQGAASESSDSQNGDGSDDDEDDDAKDGSSGDDNDDNDGQDAHGDQEMGWGAAYGRHDTHPGKSIVILAVITLKISQDFQKKLNHQSLLSPPPFPLTLNSNTLATKTTMQHGSL